MNDLSIFNKQSVIRKSLAITQNNYRPFDPGWYLYLMITNYKNNRFTKEFIELVYVTLSAWNMNSRGAKLAEFDHFYDSIIKSESKMKLLNKLSISNINCGNTIGTLESLFYDLILVSNGKPPLVTFSKTMHFFFPNLIVPIDRKYTLNYFFNTISVSKDRTKQWIVFKSIQNEFSLFAQKSNLKIYISDKWNQNIPKIMDNMIIGYMKLNNDLKDCT